MSSRRRRTPTPLRQEIVKRSMRYKERRPPVPREALPASGLIVELAVSTPRGGSSFLWRNVSRICKGSHAGDSPGSEDWPDDGVAEAPKRYPWHYGW